ncbi:uncharacterized protein LOC129244121 [Anastrepha obliqua]|uniref:uncharacterized protein LOC129244121 n=1 Tax=Anastrepha obliqua TaxID=95512 RepID=UPI002409AC1D|nr:uncharacterized protein LOC129244121 [Anastrepha obliqua]
MDTAYDEMDSYSLMSIDERLIDLVRSHEILYNKHCLGYRGAEQKQEAWFEISAQLGIAAEDCSKRWKSLRGRYSRVLKQVDTLSESKVNATVDWPLFSSLSFLRSYIKQRTSHRPLNDNNVSSFIATRPKRFKRISAESNELHDSYNPLNELRSDKMEMPIEIEAIQSLAPKVEEKVVIKKESDAVHSFGQTVAAIISEMSEAKQAKAMRILFDTLITIKTEPEETYYFYRLKISYDMETAYDEMGSYSLVSIDERLIDLVRSHKILYNKHCLGYRGAEQKQEAWFEISAQLGIAAEDCSKRWKSLRERYSRVLKQVDTLSESKVNATVDWPLFSSLSFLRSYIKQRTSRRSLNDNNVSSFIARRPKRFKRISAESNELHDSYNPLNELRSDKMEMPIEIEAIQSLAPKVEEKVVIKKESDAVHSFGQTVAAIISEMSEAKQAKAMRILFDTLITIKTEPEET